MDHHALALVAGVACALALGACQKPRPATLEPQEPKVFLPQPGEKNVLNTQDPGFQQTCARSRQKSLWIDQVDVTPATVRAGREINHRFVYTLCPQPKQRSLSGRLTTRISYLGKPVLTDTVEKFTLSPGQWAVDARIGIPPDAPPGNYSLETSFAGSGASFKRSADFVVTAASAAPGS
jgi:hypothetical protein